MPERLPPRVSVRELTKSYGAVAAVCAISFEVAAGEIFGLLGPNGAGKTTTLECILGLRRPDAGAIAIDGIDALAEPERARQRVGAQLQAATLQDKITPRQALRLFAAFYREPANTDDLIERFALSAQADTPFDALSSGQKQRLFLALAFVNNPQLVILDEPTAGLDPQSRRALHRLIADVRSSGHTVLLSTHDLGEAHHLCNRIGILDEGRLLAVARPGDLTAGTRAAPRVAVRTAKPLDPAQIKSWSHVTSCEFRDQGWLLGTSDLNRTIISLVKELESEGNELLDLQVQRPSLEDAFIELTGRAWAPPPREPD
ncbi:MAG TPA: ABC transporter ATP-binding protein [Opitutaceae bacterium]|nr:ABC transporter ATP-binding protein [Opitutaceae bacterium]